MTEMNEKLTQKIIDKFFDDNPNLLVKHQLTSYNDFMMNGIKNILKENNPISFLKDKDEETNEYNLRCNLYIGGKNGDKVYFGKPVIYDENRAHYMFPNEARLRNFTYGVPIHYDVDVDFFISEKKLNSKPKDDIVEDYDDDDDEASLTGGASSRKSSSKKSTRKESSNISIKSSTIVSNESESNRNTEEIPTETITLSKIYLGRFPIMMFSNLCLLSKLSPAIRFELGECKNDPGAYFIIDGKEKCIVSQEKFADNMLNLKDNENDLYHCSVEIRSVSEDASKPIRTMKIQLLKQSTDYTKDNIVVYIPNVRKPVPLFILMRALGIISDKTIIEYCLLDLKKNESYVDLFIPSIHDASYFFTQETCLEYIASFTKGKTKHHALEILTDYLLPHIGETNFKNKAFFIGHMVKQLLLLFKKRIPPTDRDNFKYKRVELPGTLLYGLFKEYYVLQKKKIALNIDNEYYYNVDTYVNDFTSLITNNYTKLFADKIVEDGFKKAFKGNWGAEEYTKKDGVVQDLNRLTFNSAISQLRKLNLPMDASAKVTGPRLLHSSQWGRIDPVDTPDGGNVGLHKHLAISTYITSGYSGLLLINVLRNIPEIKMVLLQESTPSSIKISSKVIINGAWVGVIENPEQSIKILKDYKRKCLISPFTSINWKINENIIYIYTDSGRLCRPIYYIDNGIPKYTNLKILEKIDNDNFTWNNLLIGFNNLKNKDTFNLEDNKIYNNYSDLFSDEYNKNLSSIIEYIDSSEEESSLITFNNDKLQENLKKKKYTHVEIHPSFIFGVMGNQVVFPENNQLPRDLFACGQMRQAVSLYHSNHQNRIDKSGLVLNYGQIPLVKSRYLKKINNEEHPYGENVVCAIMSLNGYNVEDSILFNEGSIKRGLFRTTYYNSYESYEESSKVSKSMVNTTFSNLKNELVVGLKPGFDYSELDEHGLIKENTKVTDKSVMIGKVTSSVSNASMSSDSSEYPKKEQQGFVDKTFMTEGEEGFRIAKVRIRDERIPVIGDKFCSRCGQKGTIGLIIPEADMPFTDSGIRPDIIINPHAIPSRMTIGQLVETVMGKACSLYGAFGDCTAFMNKGQKYEVFGELLQKLGFNSKCNELLYNGLTGEQLEADIFIGPTYYMRLKHMVKDKINYRAKGPRSMLTKQTVGGRANDGGLRIGEMERDGVICHGATQFLKESMLVRGDDYYMAICNQTGMVAIYNDSKNLYLSPYIDGPVRFSGSVDDIEKINIENVSIFGRSFSVIRIPYAFKLLMQELLTMNVQMRLITSDNIEQLSSMSYSDNINKLTNRNESIDTIIKDVLKKTKTKKVDDNKLARGIEKDDSLFSQDFDNDVEIMQEEKSREDEKDSLDDIVDSNNPATFGWEKVPPTKENDREIWRSLIINENGFPTSIWYNDEHDNQKPTGNPDGWSKIEAVYQDDTTIPNNLIITTLKEFNEPGNWKKTMQYLKDQDNKRLDKIAQLKQEKILKRHDDIAKQKITTGNIGNNIDNFIENNQSQQTIGEMVTSVNDTFDNVGNDLRDTYETAKERVSQISSGIIESGKNTFKEIASGIDDIVLDANSNINTLSESVNNSNTNVENKPNILTTIETEPTQENEESEDLDNKTVNSNESTLAEINKTGGKKKLISFNN